MDDAEKQLWEAYWGSRSDEDRNRLVERYMPLVQSVATRVFRLSQAADMQDLVSVGALKLVELIPAMSPEHKTFSTYATIRIRGAMLDYVTKEQRHKCATINGFYDQPSCSDGERESIDWDAVASVLSASHKTLFFMRFRDGLNLEDIAIRTGMSLAAISKSLQVIESEVRNYLINR